uniref:SWIM-type domain-containing protein n=1 Tax=Fagus sylvatica TaxID=28930 RepID=A0A2N9GWH9_FAGSY
MNISQSFVENELNDGIIDQQKEAQLEVPNGSPNKSNIPNRDNKNNVEVPKIGMKFDCDDSAYEFYKEYAHRTGFSVRKQFIKRGKTGQIKRRTFVCSKEGERGADKRREQVSFHHPISRVGCLARMTCQLQKDGMLEVVSFHEQHNHEFAPSPMKHMLRSKRKISLAQKAIGDDAEKSGISIKQTIDLLSMQAGGRENLGFLDIDYKNYVQNKRRMALKKGDGRAVMEYFHKMQLEDPSYFYAIQLDDDDLIMNIFWVDARSIVDYGHFGDVICFDTTYRTNTYDRPFAPFVGVNHHKQTIIFGAALLYDETVESFKWLFKTFLSAMSGKHPKTILTDQSAAMARAIAEVFPESNHRLCVWHIYQNAAKHLSQVFHSSKEFTDDFSHCMYDYEDEDDWLLAWDNMLQKYSLTDNKWLAGIFEVKEKWAMVYGRHMFTADMKSTQRSESINNVLKKYLKPKHDILRFLGHYSRVLADKRHQELQAEFKMRQTIPVLQVDVEMLRYVVGLYTPEMFQMFQDEYMKIGDCTIYKVSKSDAVTEYKVKYRQRTQEHLVKYEASTVNVQCNCMKFSFVGILCVHALKVLEKKNVKRLPSHYLLKRWTQDAKVGSIKDHRGIDIGGDAQELMGKRYSHLSHNFREISTFAAESEMMYEHAKRCSENLMKDLQEMRKRCYSDSMEGLHRGGIKTKPTVGRPRGRLKNALELRKNNKSRSKIVQQKARKAGKARQVQSVGCLNKVDFSVHLNSHEEHSNVRQVSHLVDNLTQESSICANLVGQDRIAVGKVDSTVHINSHEECSNVRQVSHLVDNLTQESSICANLVGQDRIAGHYIQEFNGLNQVSVSPSDIIQADHHISKHFK